MNRYPDTGIRVKESELVEDLTHFLLGQGYKIRTEVPSLGQSADVVATRGRWVTFIEVKVKDWQRAFQQCNAHSLVADYICIALGTKNISEAVRQGAIDRGIGLIHISTNRQCAWVVRPTLNVTIWKPQRKRLSQSMRDVQHAR
jgi:hypothetical protein